MRDSLIHGHADLLTRLAAKLRALYDSDALLWAIAAAGCALRIQSFLLNRSLWFDEASVALDILHRPVAAVLRELDEHQPGPVPIGFLLAARWLTLVFGDGEQALRLLPLLCGMATLPLFLKVSTQYVAAPVVPVAFALFALSPTQIYQAVECKPYISDVLFTLLVLSAAAWISDRPLTPRRAYGLCLLGGFATWCSYPVFFVLAGVGIGMIVDCVRKRDRHRASVQLAICAGWALSFGALYLTSLRFIGGNAALNDYWSEYFLPLSDFTRSRRIMTTVFIYPLDLIHSRSWLLAPLYLIGWPAILLRNQTRSFFLLLPMVATIAVSALGRYPFYGRLLLFAVPLLLLPTLEGAAQIGRWAARFRPSAGVAVAATLIGLMSIPSLASVARGPQAGSALRSLLAYVAEHSAPEDTIYVGEFDLVYEYYRPRFGLADRSYVRGPYFDGPWSTKDVETLDALRGRRRVWAVAGTPEVWQQLDRLGRRILWMPREDAALGLYDLSGG